MAAKYPIVIVFQMYFIAMSHSLHQQERSNILEYFEFEKWAACAVFAATGKIFTPEFDGFI